MKLKTLFSVFAGIALLASACSAQTALTATSLYASLDASSQFVTLTDGTAVTARGNSSARGSVDAGTASGNTLIYTQGEVFVAVAVLPPNTTGTTRTVQVIRGYQGTKVAGHVSGAVVILGPPTAFQSYSPSGACTRTLASYVPIINVTNGKIFDCGGGQWGNFTDQPQVGTVIASQAGSMTGDYAIIAKITHISGTNAITDFTLPPGLPDGGTFILIPNGAFTTTATGVIGKASTAVAGKAITYTYDKTAGLIYPSY